MTIEGVSFRELNPDDLPHIRRLGRRAFSLPVGLLMAATVKPLGYAAEDRRGGLVGVLTMRTTHIAHRDWLILDWAAVDPEYQGRGIGTGLGEYARSHVPDRQSDELIASIDGYNSASWNAAYGQGLRYWPAAQQIRDVGWLWPRLLFAIPHVGVSTFIVRRSLSAPGEQELADPATRAGRGMWLFAVAWSILVLLVSRVRDVAWESFAPADLLAPLSPAAIVVAVAVMVAYFAARASAYGLAARALRVSLGFRVWESGMLLGTILALAFGSFIPGFAGNYYVRDPRFNYLRNPAVMGKIMLSGSATSLGLFLLFSVWAGRSAAPIPIAATLGQYAGLAFAITDTVTFFPPFHAFPAGLVWSWSRAAGVVLLAAFVAIVLLVPRIV